ncbi:Uncharacterised protein [Mesomycoplasma dispar]|uniref:Uncharacterized protein n=1 Tax=Mesomycoplasma dispar TaxID=86660 RepID=A0AAJ5NMH6_9BACT|nr:hypothetical protein [Mesomycoplasma dispar]VEU61760.1 Uncharacterised protein [Mesomycoplasma dispar]
MKKINLNFITSENQLANLKKSNLSTKKDLFGKSNKILPLDKNSMLDFITNTTINTNACNVNLTGKRSKQNYI